MNPVVRLLKSIDGVILWLSKFSSTFGAICAYVVTFMIILDVAWRFIFDRTIPGLFEAVSMSVVILAYYGLSGAILSKRQLILDLISRRFKGASESAYNMACNLIGAVLFGTIAIYGWTQAWLAYTGHHTFGQSVLFPYWILWTLLCFTMSISFLVSLREVVWYSIKAISQLMIRKNADNSAG
jgi:TRAP-type C4-dicarboxylate transport system permease small subunit